MEWAFIFLVRIDCHSTKDVFNDLNCSYITRVLLCKLKFALDRMSMQIFPATYWLLTSPGMQGYWEPQPAILFVTLSDAFIGMHGTRLWFPRKDLTIGSCLACVHRVMDARRKFGEHERSVSVASFFLCHLLAELLAKKRKTKCIHKSTASFPLVLLLLVGCFPVKRSVPREKFGSSSLVSSIDCRKV